MLFIIWPFPAFSARRGTTCNTTPKPVLTTLGAGAARSQTALPLQAAAENGACDAA